MTTISVLVTLLSVACKTPCERATDHVAELAYEHSLKSAKTAAEKEAVASGLVSRSDMMPSLRKVTQTRIGPRCGDEAYLKCLMAANDPFAVNRCESSPSK